MDIVALIDIQPAIHDNQALTLFHPFLSIYMKERIPLIKNRESKIRSLMGEVLVVRLLSLFRNRELKPLSVSMNNHGKPLLTDCQGVYYNISHSGNMVTAVVSDADTGIDIEKERKMSYRISDRYFTVPELALLEGLPEPAKRDMFFTLWVLKEAYLKAKGTGISGGLSSFSMICANDHWGLMVNDEKQTDYSFRIIEVPKGYYAALCRKKPDEDVTVVRYDWQEIRMSFGM